MCGIILCMSWSDTSIPMKFESLEELNEKIERYFLSCMSPIIEWIDNPEYDKKEYDRCINNMEEYETPRKLREQKVDGNGDPVYEIIEPFTISGLALALGTNRTTLLEYQKELKTSISEEDSKAYANAIKQAKSKVENYVDKYMFTGKNQTGAIFVAKNNFGWIEKTEQDVNLGAVDPEKVKDKVSNMFNTKSADENKSDQ